MEALVKENIALKAKVKDLSTEIKDLSTELNSVKGELKGMLGQVLDGLSKLTVSEQPTTATRSLIVESPTTQPVPPATAPTTPTVVPAPSMPTVAPATTRATTNAMQEMMKKAKDPISVGEWIMSSDILLKTPVEEFLFGARLRSLNWNEPLTFGPDIKKQQKSKMKKLHDEAINSAIKSDNPALVAAGKELKSRLRIDATAADYKSVSAELHSMARLVSNNLERQLCDALGSSLYLETMVAAAAAAGKTITASKEVKKVRAGFRKGANAGCGTIYSFIKKSASKWTKPWTPATKKTYNIA